MTDVVVIGARGYTGSELLPLLWRHPDFDVTAVGSGSVAGEPLSDHVAGLQDCGLAFSSITAETLEQFPADAYVIALPNGKAPAIVEAVDRLCPDAVVVDLGADYRFDSGWTYGQPERFADRIRQSRRIANPGCYATGAQLGLLPLIEDVAETPVVFGISGYSGAGKTPSRKNDTDVLDNNILPYKLADHIHEQEVSWHVGRGVRFLPHVGQFFRGITLTIAARLKEPVRAEDLLSRYHELYSEHELLKVQTEIPEVKDIQGRHEVVIGGFTVSESDAHNVSLVVVLDNLLKGAATQAVQNLNLAFGLDALAGIDVGENAS